MTRTPADTPTPPAAHRRVAIAGASGLVGGHLLQGLLQSADVAEVHALVRRELPLQHPKLVMHLVDFRALPSLPPLDEVYLALGTTIRQAGSQEAFRAVDFDAPLAVARAALAAGATRIGLVSAIGASAHSSVFYSRVKGELEDALAALQPAALVIARPSFLVGDRKALAQPRRLGETIGIHLAQWLAPLLPRDYRAVEARRVAHALRATVPVAAGVRVLSSGALQAFDGPA